MPIDRESLLRAIAESNKPLGVGELLGRLREGPGARTELKRMVRELVREGLVLRDGKRVQAISSAEGGADEKGVDGDGGVLAPPLLMSSEMLARGGRFAIGTLRRHRDGYGFVMPLTGGRGDVFLPPGETRRALDGDVIRVEIVEGRGGRTAGRFVEVVERRRLHLVGQYRGRGKASFVVPADPAISDAVLVVGRRDVHDGDLVKVRITSLPERTEGPRGEIVEVVGKPGDPRPEVMDVAYSQGFSDEFPSDALREAEQLSEVPRQELGRRRDLRGLRLVTIDGEDARDFDDAVYVERTRAGYRLVVAIADVSAYVRPGSPLDNEALRRSTSVYFPNCVLPMLPEQLSNGLCSLMPEQDRLCMVADLIFEPDDKSARLVNAELYEAVMRSAARCTYTEVAAVLAGSDVAHRASLRDDFRLMEELARRLMASRELRGAIDLELPESRAVLDERMHPVKIERRERNIAHRIVEELMLAANEAVAHYFSLRGLPTVYRVHGAPDEEKLEVFLALARARGFFQDEGDEQSGKALNGLLRKISGAPEQRTLSTLMLRSMMQAVYSPENIGHFGLAAPHYLHFTSPIRRYPDLMVHRLLKEHWGRGGRSLSQAELDALTKHLEAISLRASERERAAMAAEREVDSYFAALYLQDKVGQVFDGLVTAVTDFGVFVELKAHFVEGLIKAERIGPGAQFDDVRHRLVFGNGQGFGLGDEVRVRVASVDPGRRQIDFALATAHGDVLPAEPAAPGGSRSLQDAIDRLKDRQVPKGKRRERSPRATAGDGASGGGRSGASAGKAGRTPSGRRKGR